MNPFSLILTGLPRSMPNADQRRSKFWHWSQCQIATLGHSHYILWLTIPQNLLCWNHVRQEKEKTFKLLFYFFLRHAINVPCNHIRFRGKTCNTFNGIFLLFFLPILFFIFLFPTSQIYPCRNPSTIEYNACALIT